MTDRATGGSDDVSETVRRTSAGDGPSLPYAKAFVVQFTAGTDAGLEHASGRVEHLQSGRRERFDSADDLLLWIAAMLPRPADPPSR
jgi:hypothetical protein